MKPINHLLEGGPGSGNFGHAGRDEENQRGGSLPSDARNYDKVTDSFGSLDLWTLQHIELEDDLSEEEILSADEYLRTSHWRDIQKNAVLNKIDPAILSLDSAISKSRILKDVVLYRALRVPDELGLDFKNWEGKIFESKTFVSTSLSRSEATGYLTAPWRKGLTVLAQIKVPKGTNGLDITREVAPRDDNGEEPFRTFEVVLPRNTKFRVEKFENDILYLEIMKGNQ